MCCRAKGRQATSSLRRLDDRQRLQAPELVGQLNRRTDAHFFKNMRSVELDGAWGNAEMVRNGLVVVTANQFIQNFTLTRTQTGQRLLEAIHLQIGVTDR